MQLLWNYDMFLSHHSRVNTAEMSVCDTFSVLAAVAHGGRTNALV